MAKWTKNEKDMRRTAFGIAGLLEFTALVALGFIIIDGFGLPPPLREEAAERPTLAGDDVVEHDWSEYNKQYPIENSYFVIIQGKKVADRCSVTVERLRGTKGRLTVVRESAVNLSTCEYLMEVGDMSAKAEEARKEIRPGKDGGTSSEKPNFGEPVSEGYHEDSELGP